MRLAQHGVGYEHVAALGGLSSFRLEPPMEVSDPADFDVRPCRRIPTSQHQAASEALAFSAMAASSLMNEIFVASIALAAYLVSSAE